MESKNFGITKSSLTPNRGDSIADHNPNTSGWNVITSSEVSPDGKSYKMESLATTEGVKKIAGGHSQFAERNEHMQKSSHQGDDKNYVKTSGDESKTQHQENIVIGDEKGGHIKQKSHSVVSSSHTTTTKQFSSGPEAVLDHQKLLKNFDQLDDDATTTKRTNALQQQHQRQQQQTSVETRDSSSTSKQEYQVKKQHHEVHHQQKQQQHHQQTQNERQTIEDNSNQERFQTNQLRTQDTIQGEPIRRKLTQEEIDLYAAKPGKIISTTVDYPDPNTKVITETKTLPDGTTVTIRRYETKSDSSQPWTTSSNRKESM